MANQDGKTPGDVSQAAILERIERLVAESRVNTPSRDQPPPTPRQVQDIGENRNPSSHDNETPKGPRNNAFYNQFPLTPGRIQNSGRGEGLLASRHNENIEINHDNGPRSQVRPTPLKVQNTRGNRTSTPPHDQTPRGPRNNFSNNNLPLRPRKFANVDHDQGVTPRQNGNSSVPRQTIRSQNWHSHLEQDSSAHRHQNSNAGNNQNPNTGRGKGENIPWNGNSSIGQKKGRQDENWNYNRNQNSKARQNQHTASKFISGKKNPKASTHDDWRHEDAINDEDLARWYE